MSGTFITTTKKRRASSRRTWKKGTRLLIVGNGMVGAKFCEELVSAGLHEKFQIKLIGEESYPAYNRIKLSSYVIHQDHTSLELLNRDWYEENKIKLLTGIRAESIDRQNKQLKLSNSSELPYDLLVLATGSRPFVPPIPGADLANVFLYRTIADLEKIITRAQHSQSATIIGGGLLGIEAAQALQSLNLKTELIERANFLMPQQLTQAGGDLLKREVEEQNIGVHLGIQKTTIEPSGDQLTLTLDETKTLTADLVLISAGITPNSEIAETANLPTGVRGGIIVDENLETEDSDIFAIGECALLHGRIYGLAAPGYTMAKYLAQRLAGKRQKPLAPLDLSTRLKMLGVDVTTIGDPLQEGRRLEFSTEDCYRTLILGRKGRLVGALAIGNWEENGRVHAAYISQKKISEKQQNYFTEEGLLFPGVTIENPADWSEERVVCNCTNTPKGEIMACLAQCQNDPDRVAACTGASTVCGSCRPLVEQLCGAPLTAPTGKKSVTALLLASILSLGVIGYAMAAPPIAMAESVESFWFKVEQLWRDNFIKQITGYSLMGIFLIGLIISLRKRLSWFKWGKFTTWRFFHAAFGLASLGALWAHTGFHFGANLNFWLMFVFVMLNLLGAVAGIVTAIEARGTSSVARRLRPILTWAHLILFWPLPVLLTFHILSVYLY